MDAIFMLSGKNIQVQIGMNLRSGMQKNKYYDLMNKKRRIIEARQVAGTGTRGGKLNIVHQILQKFVVLSGMVKNWEILSVRFRRNRFDQFL